jgi:phosphatidylinositol alpha-mannosyltransferase
MRIALVSPYSWTYPGGVTRHIEALAGQFFARGHDVRVFAPYDPPDRLAARLHRGARPEPRALPEWVVPLGRTIGIKANGAVSNLSLFPEAVTTLRRELRAGGVDVPDEVAPPEPEPGAPLRLAFVGQTVERKGLPVLLRAFEALREHVPVELVLVGAEPEDVAPLMLDGDEGVTVLGKVSDAEKAAALAKSDLLVAPSLGGESFGMVLTEAFAAGTPVVASDIPGYRDVVRDGVDGVLVPRGDGTALAETLRDLALDPARRTAMAAAAREHAHRYAWPTVAGEVLEAYDAAAALPQPETTRQRAGIFLGAVSADLGPRRPPERRLPSLDTVKREGRNRRRAAARKVGIGVAGVAASLLAFEALQRIGLDKIGASLLRATPTWVLLGLGLMCASMAVRGVAWHAILRAAIPGTRLRAFDALQGTFIGVLMSATLPARLGEPSRALVVARRTGRPREYLPTVVGTIVSQALLNVVALVGLGMVMFSTVDLFSHRQRALAVFAIAPVAMLVAVLFLPALLRGGVPSRSRRVQAAVAKVRGALAQVRAGLRVFRAPRLGAEATALQLLAWAVQWLSCYVLLVALGLDERAGVGAAAAVLFAVNVTSVLPVTPSNLGVFQFACATVLHGAYHVGWNDALAYGIILQAVEIATAVVMGAPALVKEGMSWRDVRLRALHASPVQLDPLPGAPRPAEAAAAEA